MNETDNSDEESLVAVLPRLGYIAVHRIAQTLQGAIWQAIDTKSGEYIAIKVASKQLHNQQVGITNGVTLRVQEDILKEKHIMKYLSSFADCPPSIIRYQRLFATQTDYYLAMQYGGTSLFDFVVKAHALLRNKQISTKHWTKLIRCMFKQIVDGVAFMHSKNICCYDVSLENMTLLNDLSIAVGEDDKITFTNIDREVQVKLVDYGLAEKFKPNADQTQTQRVFPSAKFCGKTNYQSPEIVEKRVFDAAANDVWCCGVSLFMMAGGYQPWRVAKKSEASFEAIMNGQMKRVLHSYGVSRYFDADLVDLLQSILQRESKRISISGIQKHAWLNK